LKPDLAKSGLAKPVFANSGLAKSGLPSLVRRLQIAFHAPKRLGRGPKAVFEASERFRSMIDCRINLGAQLIQRAIH
jgi:hypothetical protein